MSWTTPVLPITESLKASVCKGPRGRSEGGEDDRITAPKTKTRSAGRSHLRLLQRPGRRPLLLLDTSGHTTRPPSESLQSSSRAEVREEKMTAQDLREEIDNLLLNTKPETGEQWADICAMEAEYVRL